MFVWHAKNHHHHSIVMRIRFKKIEGFYYKTLPSLYPFKISTFEYLENTQINLKLN